MIHETRENDGLSMNVNAWEKDDANNVGDISSLADEGGLNYRGHGNDQGSDSTRDQLIHMDKTDKNGLYNGAGDAVTALNTDKDNSHGQEEASQDNVSDPTSNNISEPIADFDQEEPLQKKRRRGDPSKWKKNVNMRKREFGEEYTGRKYVEGSKQFDVILKHGRELGQRCQCKVQQNQCCSITDEERLEAFKEFWRWSWSEKDVFIHSMVEKQDKQRKRTLNDESKRSNSFFYHLKIKGQRKRVCKKMFLSTTGLKNTFLHDHIKSRDFNNINEEHTNKRNAPENRGKEFLKEFLANLPKMPSHYCRQSTAKMYLEPIFHTVADLYKVYNEKCKERAVKAMGRTVFTEVVKEMNIGLFQPRKDQCDICCSFEAGNLSTEEWNAHRQRKEMAQAEKARDKQTAIEGKEKLKVLTMDMQRVLLSPCLQASAMYYKTKLAVHNFTVFDLGTKQTTCYVWNESEGGVTGNEFATCIFKHLEKDLAYDKYIIFSDGCTYQNRNCIMSTALRHFARKHGKEVIQKYLEKGHTQMEVDSCHSKIEARLKNRQIFVPYDYITAIKEARQNPSQYDVEYLDHTYFLNFSAFNSLKSIRPGRNAGDPTVTCIRAIRYLPDGTIAFKLNFDSDWSPMPQRRGEITCLQTPMDLGPPILYPSRLKISKSKFEHLQQLKTVIPQDYHEFYNNLSF